MHNRHSVLEYWNQADVESMYDKNLLNAEIALIRSRIPVNSKILDAGCGEGEGTLIYSAVPGVFVHAGDFSETRLALAQTRLAGRSNVVLQQVDFLGDYNLDMNFDVVISQRFLLNLLERDLQYKVAQDLMARLKPGVLRLQLPWSTEYVATAQTI